MEIVVLTSPCSLLGSCSRSSSVRGSAFGRARSVSTSAALILEPGTWNLDPRTPNPEPEPRTSNREPNLNTN